MGAAAAEADRTLFVGNLDPKVTEELIFELFHQAGPVVKVKIPRDRDGRPKQFAFVNFKHEESVPYGLSLLNGIKLYGRPIKIQFRSGSSHASQDGNTARSPHRAASASPAGAPHPPPTCGRYDRNPESLAAGYAQGQRPVPSAEHLQRHGVMSSAVRPQPPFGAAYEQPGFAPPAYQHPPPPHAFLPAPRRPEPPAPRKARPGAHPYHGDGRHAGREQRFGERGPDYGRGKWEEHGLEEQGAHGAEPQHRAGGRHEPAYDERHRDGWSHDYDYRRESYREGRWHPSRH